MTIALISAAPGAQAEDEHWVAAPEVEATLAAMASETLDDLDEVGAELADRAFASIPGLSLDHSIDEEGRKALRAHLATFFTLVAAGGRTPQRVLPPEVRRHARSFALRGRDPAPLSHALRLGGNFLIRWWASRLAQQVRHHPLLTDALAEISDRIIDQTEASVTAIHDFSDELRGRWQDGAMARRAQVVDEILDGGLTGDPAGRKLGYDLNRRLIAAVLWSEERGEPGDGRALDGAAQAIAVSLGAARALTVTAGSATLWAWLAVPGTVSAEEVAQAADEACDDSARVALGSPGHGIEAFRWSHWEALRAREVAAGRRPDRVLRFDTLEVVALASSQEKWMGHFVRRTLGPLAHPDASDARLRETLLAYLAEGGNSRRAADRLTLHKNTVLYRIQRVEALLGHPLHERRLELELALTLVETLGERALGKDAGSAGAALGGGIAA